jgi:hypothetical protein
MLVSDGPLAGCGRPPSIPTFDLSAPYSVPYRTSVTHYSLQFTRERLQSFPPRYGRSYTPETLPNLAQPCSPSPPSHTSSGLLAIFVSRRGTRTRRSIGSEAPSAPSSESSRHVYGVLLRKHAMSRGIRAHLPQDGGALVLTTTQTTHLRTHGPRVTVFKLFSKIARGGPSSTSRSSLRCRPDQLYARRHRGLEHDKGRGRASIRRLPAFADGEGNRGRKSVATEARGKGEDTK